MFDRVKLSRCKLGRRARRVDARTLRLANYFAAGLATPPPAADWLTPASNALGGNFGEMLNDSLGDCTCAAIGHAVQTLTAAAHGTPETLSDGDILAAYEAVGGYVPGREDTDNGAAELNVLNYWKNTGCGGDTIAGYAAINPLNLTEVQQAIALLGGAYLGVELPLCAQAASSWQLPANLNDPSAQPGSWGGHAIWCPAYNAQGPVVITWGEALQVSWSFFTEYFDEAYAVVSPDFVQAQGQTPAGLGLAQMMADLAAL